MYELITRKNGQDTVLSRHATKKEATAEFRRIKVESKDYVPLGIVKRNEAKPQGATRKIKE